MDDKNLASPSSSSLEGTDSLSDLDSASVTPPPNPSRRRLPHGFKRLAIIAAVLLLLSGGGFGIAMLAQKSAKKTPQSIVVNTQSLDNGTLNKLTTQSGGNGAVRQQLTITPSTLFKNDVTIQHTLNVASDTSIGGNLQVRGSSNLLGPVATGSNLSVGGGLSVGRNTTIGGSLSVSGQITAGGLSVGTITPTNITASGNISWAGHLISTGSAPSVRTDNAAGGGTATISGNDSSGVVTINTGGGALPSGSLGIISFHNAYSLAPHIQLTPASSAAASLPYYAASHSTFFQINAAGGVSPNASYAFYYLVTQ